MSNAGVRRDATKRVPQAKPRTVRATGALTDRTRIRAKNPKL